MRRSVMSACCVVLLFALSSALPMAQPAAPQEVTLVEVLPSQAQETLTQGETKSDVTRDKRTIGFLRETFPSLTEIIDRKIQTITRFVFRLIGRLVLGGGGGGAGTDTSESGGTGASSSAAGGTGRRISITLPTYPPSLDDDEDDEEEVDEDDSSKASSNNDVLAAASDSLPSTAEPPASLRRSDSARRVARATADQETAASDAQPAVEDTAADDSENRDKRFLFGFGGGEGGSGSAGGSGNFLFDIIRLIAGSGTTEEAGDAGHDTTSSTGTGFSAGASIGYSNGAAIGNEAPELGHGDKDDGYTSGIPGPITRLFIIANRGVSNLIQDLILRLAQTSERIVNFKARLITSII